MNEINIEEILKKYRVEAIAKKFSHVAIMGDIDSRIKAAIKEIAEAIVDKCAEEANSGCVYGNVDCPEGTKYITTYSNPNGPDEEYYIDKESILKVKT